MKSLHDMLDVAGDPSVRGRVAGVDVGDTSAGVVVDCWANGGYGVAPCDHSAAEDDMMLGNGFSMVLPAWAGGDREFIMTEKGARPP
jgi:hypothetical protein